MISEKSILESLLSKLLKEIRSVIPENTEGNIWNKCHELIHDDFKEIQLMELLKRMQLPGGNPWAIFCRIKITKIMNADYSTNFLALFGFAACTKSLFFQYFWISPSDTRMEQEFPCIIKYQYYRIDYSEIKSIMFDVKRLRWDVNLYEDCK